MLGHDALTACRPPRRKEWPIAGWSFQAARDRVADQVRERDLHLACRASFSAWLSWRRRRVERRHRDGAEARRGRDRQALRHVAREHRVGAAHRLASARRRRGGAVRPRHGRLRRRRRRAARGTSSFTTRPPVPVPLTWSRSMPCAAATRRATGVTWRRPATADGRRRSPWRAAAGAVRRRCRRGGGLCAAAAAALARRPSAAGASLGLELRQRLADLDGLVLLGEDLHQLARRGRGHLGVDLVGRDLDDRLVLVDPVALLLVPGEHRALGHRLAHLGHRDLNASRPWLGCSS